MKNIVLSLFLIFILSGCKENLFYTNDIIYDCKTGDYSFPESEPIFKSISVNLIDFNGMKGNECLLSLDYKIKFKPTDNPYYEIDFDTCKLTMIQLSYFKEKKADITTILKDASCDQNTNQFLDKANKPLDFKRQVGEIIAEFSTSTTEFTATVTEWRSGSLTSEELQQAIKDEKLLASKTFKDLKDLQPKAEEQDIQTKAVKTVELYLDSLNSFEGGLNAQSLGVYQNSMNNSVNQMDEATQEILELAKLLG